MLRAISKPTMFMYLARNCDGAYNYIVFDVCRMVN